MSGDSANKPGGQFHFNPETYLQNIRREVPDYDAVQDAIFEGATSGELERFLDLGAGTGETALRILGRYPQAKVVLVEEQERMLPVLNARFKNYSASIAQSDFGDSFPEGPYCAVVSAFAVHHLKGIEKKALFVRIHAALREGGRWVFGDVFTPDKEEDRRTPIDIRYDHPSTTRDVCRWLEEAGFSVSVAWQKHDLAVLACIK